MKVINLCFFASSKNTSECVCVADFGCLHVCVCGFMRVGIYTFKWINDGGVCEGDETNGSRKCLLNVVELSLLCFLFFYVNLCVLILVEGISLHDPLLLYGV